MLLLPGLAALTTTAQLSSKPSSGWERLFFDPLGLPRPRWLTSSSVAKDWSRASTVCGAAVTGRSINEALSLCLCLHLFRNWPLSSGAESGAVFLRSLILICPTCGTTACEANKGCGPDSLLLEGSSPGSVLAVFIIFHPGEWHSEAISFAWQVVDAKLFPGNRCCLVCNGPLYLNFLFYSRNIYSKCDGFWNILF